MTDSEKKKIEEEREWEKLRDTITLNEFFDYASEIDSRYQKEISAYNEEIEKLKEKRLEVTPREKKGIDAEIKAKNKLKEKKAKKAKLAREIGFGAKKYLDSYRKEREKEIFSSADKKFAKYISKITGDNSIFSTYKKETRKISSIASMEGFKKYIKSNGKSVLIDESLFYGRYGGFLSDVVSKKAHDLNQYIDKDIEKKLSETYKQEYEDTQNLQSWYSDEEIPFEVELKTKAKKVVIEHDVRYEDVTKILDSKIALPDEISKNINDILKHFEELVNVEYQIELVEKFRSRINNTNRQAVHAKTLQKLDVLSKRLDKKKNNINREIEKLAKKSQISELAKKASMEIDKKQEEKRRDELSDAVSRNDENIKDMEFKKDAVVGTVPAEEIWRYDALSDIGHTEYHPAHDIRMVSPEDAKDMEKKISGLGSENNELEEGIEETRKKISDLSSGIAQFDGNHPELIGSPENQPNFEAMYLRAKLEGYSGSYSEYCALLSEHLSQESNTVENPDTGGMKK